jgi:ribosomal-protein-alanine N-acetyltransferase
LNTNFTPFPKLITERLLLRRLVADDAPALRELRSDHSINKYLDRPKSMSVEESMAFVKKIDDNLANSKGCYWVICFKEDHKLIGTICLWNFDLEKDIADLGYELMPAYQSKGIMLEAVKSVIDYGFAMMKLKMILGLTHPENNASRNLLERVNFEQDLSYAYVSKEEAGEDA